MCPPNEIDPLTPGSISRHFREKITPKLDLYDANVPLDISRDVYLSQSENFRDIVDVTMRHPERSDARVFHWHIPRVDSTTRAIALEVDSNIYVTSSKIIELKGQDLFQIQIAFRLPPKGSALRIRFSVLMGGMTRITEMGWLRRRLFEGFRFPFSFVPAASVESYQLRIHVPKGISFTSDTGFGDFERFDLHDETILVGGVSQPVVGTVSGFVEVWNRRRTYETLVTGTLSILLGAAVAVAQLVENPPLAIILIVAVSMTGGTILWETIGKDRK